MGAYALGVLELLKVIGEIRARARCSSCLLLGRRRPLVIEPRPRGSITVIAVTESPREDISDVEDAVSIYNVPIFPYLYCLLSGEFRPREDANAYWTHVCKCCLKGIKPREGRRAMEACSDAYLKSEVEAVKPRLVVAVGAPALKFFSEATGDGRLRGGLREVFRGQINGIYGDVKLGSARFSLAVAPHPSGRSRLWNRLDEEDKMAFKRVISEIKVILGEPSS